MHASQRSHWQTYPCVAAWISLGLLALVAVSLLAVRPVLGLAVALGTAVLVLERRIRDATVEHAAAARTAALRAELAERAHAQEALRESRRTLNLVLDMIPQAVWWKDLDCNYLGCNAHVARAAGLSSPADIVGKSDFDLPWTREQAEHFRAVDRRVMAGNRAEHRIIERQLWADGTEAWLETNKVPLHDAAGRVVGILGTYEDVTGRHRAAEALQAGHDEMETRVRERTAELALTNGDLRCEIAERARADSALRESEERLRLALQAGRMSVWRIDPVTDQVEWTTIRRDQGWTSETFPGTFNAFLQNTHPDDIATTTAVIERCRTDGTPFNLQYRFLRRRDGEVRWLESRGQPVHDAGGRLLTITGLSMDITERKRAEEALRASEARLRLALEAGCMSVWRFESTTNAFTWFDGRRGHAWTPGTFPESLEALGRALPPEDFAKVTTALERARVAGEPVSLQYRYTRPSDGHMRWVETRGQPVYDPAGRLESIVGVSTDITGRKCAEEQLQGAKAEAERANAAKSEFLSRMSHELRTPLNAILGFGQLLELADLDEKHLQSVGYILRAGRHLLGLIDEVLDISSIESGNLTLCAESISVKEFLDELLALLRPLATGRSVRLLACPRDTAPCNVHVLADRQRLKQVLINLLSNAIKYNRPGGEVRVSCRTVPGPGKDRLRVEVQDTGRGLSAEQITRLFTPFERLGASREGIEGTGIGLAISKRLAEAMGGCIGVESTPGVGSTFSVELPHAVAGEPGLIPAPGLDTAAHAVNGHAVAWNPVAGKESP